MYPIFQFLLFLIVSLIFSPLFPTPGFCGSTTTSPDGLQRHITIYGSNLLTTQGQKIAKNYQTVVTGVSSSNYSGVVNVKNLNPKIKVDFYLSLDGIAQSNDEWSEVNGNEAWFLHDPATGKRIISWYFGWYLMDMRKSDYQNYVISYIKQKFQNYPLCDGVFLDDTIGFLDSSIFSIEGATVQTQPVINQQCVTDYHNGTITFLKNLKTALGNKVIITNGNYCQDYLSYADGLMLEGFVHSSYIAPTTLVSPLQWTEQMLNFKTFAQLGKIILVQPGSLGTETDDAQVFLASLASYLMFSNNNTSFYFNCASDAPATSQLPQFKQLYQSVGTSGGSVMASTDGGNTWANTIPNTTTALSNVIFKRSFTHADVYMNSTANTISFLSGTNKISIPAQSGLIIYKITPDWRLSSF